jgi:hypothetical protein
MLHPTFVEVREIAKSSSRTQTTSASENRLDPRLQHGYELRFKPRMALEPRLCGAAVSTKFKVMKWGPWQMAIIELHALLGAFNRVVFLQGIGSCTKHRGGPAHATRIFSTM